MQNIQHTFNSCRFALVTFLIWEAWQFLLAYGNVWLFQTKRETADNYIRSRMWPFIILVSLPSPSISSLHPVFGKAGDTLSYQLLKLLLRWNFWWISFVIPGQQPTVCQYQYQQQKDNAARGAFIPRCKPDGSYDDVQCRGSVCYCADRRGHELSGTRVSIGAGSPQCATPGISTLFYHSWLVGYPRNCQNAL